MRRLILIASFMLLAGIIALLYLQPHSDSSQESAGQMPEILRGEDGLGNAIAGEVPTSFAVDPSSEPARSRDSSQIARLGTLRGIVQEKDRTPVSKALICLSDDEIFERVFHNFLRDVERHPEAMNEAMKATLERAWIKRQSESGPRGEFEIREGEGARFSVYAVKDGRRSQEASWTPRYGQTENIVLTLEPGEEISGSLLGPSGEPIAEGRVEAFLQWDHPYGQTIESEVVETTSDAAGRFSFTRLDPGEYALLGSKEGFAPSLPIAVRAGQTSFLILSLHRSAWIEGTVLRQDQKPAVSVIVAAIAEIFLKEPKRTKRVERDWTKIHTTPESSSLIVRNAGIETLTGEDGSFRLGPFREGEAQRLQVFVNGTNGPHLDVGNVVPGGKPIKILITDQKLRGCAFSARFFNHDGSPALDLKYRLRSSLNEGAWLRADFKGRAYTNGLVEGDRYILEVEDKRMLKSFHGPWVARDEASEMVIRLGQPAEVEFDFGKAAWNEKAGVKAYWKPILPDTEGILFDWIGVPKETKTLLLYPGEYHFFVWPFFGGDKKVRASVEAGKRNIVKGR